MSINKEPEITDLIGKTIVGVSCEIGSDSVVFECSDGNRFHLCHFQDCCESVRVEHIEGYLSNLLGTITYAEENTSAVNPEGIAIPEYQDSFTWTTYRLETEHGKVVIRWYGESNGYYSESVSFRKI